MAISVYGRESSEREMNKRERWMKNERMNEKGTGNVLFAFDPPYFQFWLNHYWNWALKSRKFFQPYWKALPALKIPITVHTVFLKLFNRKEPAVSTYYSNHLRKKNGGKV